MLAYADPTALGQWLDPDAADPAALAKTRADAAGIASLAATLLRATEVVEAACLTGYTCDVDGVPHDEDVAAWLRDATCAQVEFWLLVSESHDVAGLSGQLSVEGMSHELPGTIAPRAVRVLDLAGLRSPVGGWRSYYRTPLELIGRRP